MSSLEIAVKLPPGIPSITINGLVLPDNENFEKVYPMILMIKSKIEYRASKNDEKRKMKGFKTFLIEAINYIQKENKSEKGYKAFKDFVIFFEAIVGYSYGEGITK